MGLSAEQLRTSLDALAEREPAFAAALAYAGYPEPRIRERGYVTLLRTIVGQQVSYKAADAVWKKLEALLGDASDPARIATKTDEELRAAGLSRQKSGYARSLADEVLSGRTQVEVVRETERVLAFRHTRPQWAEHVVVILKSHVPSLIDFGDAPAHLLEELLEVVREVASDVGAERGGAHIVTNVGKYQESKHLHFHVGSD